MARPSQTDAATRRVIIELERRQLLLQAGREFASVANLVAGEEIRGSWWAHSKSNQIYWVCEDLEADPRVGEARLIAGKVTHLWQTIWPDVAAVAIAREPWQTAGLSRAAVRLLASVDDAPVRADSLTWKAAEKLGDVCRQLERRLLVSAREVHTDSGKHTKVLTSWQRWAADHQVGTMPEPDDARARLEQLVGGSSRLLPWHSAAKRSTN